MEIHRLISGDVVSVTFDLIGGRHGHLALTMTYKEYTEQTVFAFVPPHNRKWCLFHVLLGCHRQCEVSVLDSSEV